MLNRFQLGALSNEDLDALFEDVKRERQVRRLDGRRSFLAKLSPLPQDEESHEWERQLLALPKINEPLEARRRYAKALMAQDWSHVFPCEDSGTRFYVYAHVDPSDRAVVVSRAAGGNYRGTPFYIGKGCGTRAYDLKRNQGHGKMISKVLGMGYQSSDIVRIIADNLTESQALAMESKLIYLFGTIYEPGRIGAILYNLDVPSRPKFSGYMPKLLPTKKENK